MLQNIQGWGKREDGWETEKDIHVNEGDTEKQGLE
jgi:hypothetical protein